MGCEPHLIHAIQDRPKNRLGGMCCFDDPYDRVCSKPPGSERLHVIPVDALQFDVTVVGTTSARSDGAFIGIENLDDQVILEFAPRPGPDGPCNRLAL
jgi:hypothetical protein